MEFIEFGSSAYRRIFFSMLFGSTVTFAILYGPQTLIHIFAEEFNVSPSTASFTVSFATFTLAFGMLFISVFANAWGRKKIMGVSLISVSLLTILAAFSPNFGALMFIRILQGISMAGFPAIALTYLSEEISAKNVGRITGSYVGGTAIGAFLGRVIVSTLTDFYSWKLALLILGLFSFFCSVSFWLSLPESRHFKKINISFANWTSGMLGALTTKELCYLYGMGFLIPGVYVALFNYIGFPLSKPPYNLSQTVIGLLFICQLAGSMSSHVFGKLTERYSRPRLISSAITMSLIGSLMTLSSNIFILIAGLILFALGFFASHAIATGWVGVVAHPGLKAYASALYLFFYYTGSSLIGWLGGKFLSLLGWSGVIYMDWGILLLTGLLIVVISRSPRLESLKTNI